MVLGSLEKKVVTCVVGLAILPAFSAAASLRPPGQNAGPVYYQACLSAYELELAKPDNFYIGSGSLEPRFAPSSAVKRFVRSQDFQEGA